MLIEQSLLHLPEILSGSGYPKQSYEGGIVGAFSLALLQALNGRNATNPISMMHAERPYRGERPWPGPDTTGRYLRADLHLTLDRLRVGSRALAAYGWRHENWVEAKFFRRSTTIQLQNTASLLADLIRLLALVPAPDAHPAVTRNKAGRYLLHVYEGLDPWSYLSARRRIHKRLRPREWLTPLLTHGTSACPRIRLADAEVDGVLGQINRKLGEIEFEFKATTFRLDPIEALSGLKQYTCALSRIDSFAIAHGNVELRVGADRSLVESPSRAEVDATVREYVGRWLNTKEDVDREPPPPAELLAPEEPDGPLPLPGAPVPPAE